MRGNWWVHLPLCWEVTTSNVAASATCARSGSWRYSGWKHHCLQDVSGCLCSVPSPLPEPAGWEALTSSECTPSSASSSCWVQLLLDWAWGEAAVPPQVLNAAQGHHSSKPLLCPPWQQYFNRALVFRPGFLEHLPAEGYSSKAGSVCEADGDCLACTEVERVGINISQILWVTGWSFFWSF